MTQETTHSIPSVNDKNYGFIIDNRKCIGCHACSVACKSENEVPLSVNRTWVKYVEAGQYPDVRRHFQVTRCNHCANPPCARICPTQAMYQRKDGIVEFDSSVCIGCKACMQACPYDAIYIDPDTKTAAKCHYCAHRVENNIEPACVVVCPTQAIISGDMNDPSSHISHLLATEKITVRKPEQGTSPKLFYIEGNDISLHPTATERVPDSYMWADSLSLHGDGHNGNGHQAHTVPAVATSTHSNGTALRLPQQQGQPNYGPIQIAHGRMAEQMVQVAYNAQHKIPWHWPVPAYLVTKGIAAGIFMLMVLGMSLKLFVADPLTNVIASFTSLAFIGITTFFLVIDLERPERFLYILMRPNWSSWLARGAVLLIGFSTVLGIWWALETASYFGWIGDISFFRTLLMWVGLPFALGTAVYTAFLFAQAEGRDLWQSPLLPIHLVIQSLMMGGAAIMLIDLFIEMPLGLSWLARSAFLVMVVIDLFVTLLGEFGIPHASEVAARAAHEISHGRYKQIFWTGSIMFGHVIAFALVLTHNTLLQAIAAIMAAVGLYMFEYAFVMAPQEIPNS